MKLFISFLIFFSFLQAGDVQDVCTKDMSVMMSSYYDAQKEHSDTKYQNSIDAAYRALESCQDRPTYDFNVMYDFIMASRRALYEYH
jgi:hypothetical protein